MTIGIAVAVFAIGVLVAWQQLQTSQTASSPQNVQTTTESQPSTEKLPEDKFTKHTAAPDEPRYLFIAKIGVKSTVHPLGITPDNYLEAPNNIHDTGWYHQSAKPGSSGAMVIDGHVGLDQTPGVFHQLGQLQAGDTMTIERGDGTLLNYQVVRSQTYGADNVDMHAALNPVSGQPGLNLITCAGAYDQHTQTFDQRLVVYAEQF